jgi:tetratricopeptide (TPR) repeat protein
MRRSLALAFTLAAVPALVAGQDSAAPMIHGAEVRIAAKNWDDARQFLLEEAIPAHPESAELWYWLGVVHAQGTERDTEEAAKAFAKADELANPEDTDLKSKIDSAVEAIWGPLVNAAAKAAESGDLVKAEALLKRATSINPNGYEAWLNLGAVYVRQKKSSEAVQAYEKALPLVEGDAAAETATEAAAAGDKGQPEKAEKAADDSEASPTEMLRYNLGILYHQVGRDARAAGDSAKAGEYLRKAEATYKAYLQTRPDDVDIINSLASLYQERGDEAKMRETLGQVATAETANAIDLYNAGLAALKGKEYAKAEEAFKKALAASSPSDPEHAQISTAGRENLGLALIQQKKYDEAIQVLNELIASNPDDATAATAHEYLGFAYRDAGRKDEAAAAFAKSEELKKKGGGGT